MNKYFRKLSHCVTLALYGISTFTLFPSVDYTEHISTPEQMSKKCWERTGKTLQATIDEYRRNHEKPEEKP